MKEQVLRRSPRNEEERALLHTLIDMLHAGATRKQIAEKLGITQAMVIAYRKNFLTTREAMEQKKASIRYVLTNEYYKERKLTKQHLKIWTMTNQRASVLEIAREAGLSRSSVIEFQEKYLIIKEL